MKIAILSNGNANYSTKRLVEVAKARGHEVRVVKYKNAYASIEQNHPVLRYRGKDLGGFGFGSNLCAGYYAACELPARKLRAERRCVEMAESGSGFAGFELPCIYFVHSSNCSHDTAGRDGG